MKLRDNDVGLVWDRTTMRTSRAPSISTPPPRLPPGPWVPPTSLPQIAGRGIKRLGVDVEACDPELRTKGPGYRRGSYIVGLSLAWEEEPEQYVSHYFPIRHEAGGNLDPDLVLGWARGELNKFEGAIVGQKLDYDLDALANEGIDFRSIAGIHDVGSAEPLLDEWRRSYSLDSICETHGITGKDTSVFQAAAERAGWNTVNERMDNLWRLHSGYVGAYAEADADRPLRVIKVQLAKLEAEGLLDIYMNVERKLIPIVVEMRRRGVRIDVDAAERARAALVVERAELLAKVRRFCGASAEFMAAASLAPGLRERGIKVPLTAKTGVDSVTKDLLQEYEGDELVDAISAGRKIDNAINTFVDGQILGHQINGRLHPVFKPSKSDDGGSIARFSCATPDLHNVPARDKKLAPIIRGIFIPEEGEEWQRDDMSQMEYRLLCHFAVGRGAEEAREKYRTDPKTDFHKLCAAMLDADPDDDILRMRIKNTNFAKGYGAQAPKLARTFGCSLEEAKRFIARYEAALPFTKKTFDKAKEWADRRGFVTTILGRKMRFPFWQKKGTRGGRKGGAFVLSREEAAKEWGVHGIERAWTYMALNRKNQGSNADAIKKWMVDAWEAGICAVLGPYLLTVHDELATSIPRTKAADEAGRELTRIGERAIKLKVPVIVNMKRAENWGKCK